MEKQEHGSSASSTALQQAAGVMLLNAGKFLLIRRAAGDDNGGKWDFPGGGVEDGETPEQAAIRECKEEAGFDISGPLSQVSRTDKFGADYTTYVSNYDGETDPVLSAEHDAFHWATIDEAKEMPLHPGVAYLLGIEHRADSAPTSELDVAIAIRDGKLESPQKYGNITLFDVRITGTGVSFRQAHNEFVLRKPELYLNDEFLMRCQGLPVILEHPEAASLNSEEFSDRIIGTTLLPYIKGSEVWGIVKIYDDAAAKIMSEHQTSTSPAVVFYDPAANEKMDLGDGKHLLIEGKPSLLDHLAVVEHGVWDKGGKPSGVKSGIVPVEMTATTRSDSADPNGSSKGEINMADLNPEEVAKKDAGGEGMGEILSLLKSLDSRMSKLELAETAELAGQASADEGSAEQPGELAQPALDNAQPSPEIEAIAKRVDALEQSTKPMPEEEAAKMADAQAKADSVYSAFGESAPRPMMGESLLAYKKRLAAKLQPHSARAKAVNIGAIADASVLAMVEETIYADALEVAGKPAEIPAGTLREVSRQDATGRKITEFQGDVSAWTAPFKAQTRYLHQINKQVH